MAMAAGIGADLEAALDARPGDEASIGLPAVTHSRRYAAFWFGEDQARYVITARESDTAAVLELSGVNGVPVRRIGTTGGSALTLPGERPILVTSLTARFENWFPDYMSGGNRRSGV
jgi:phosphoribosylformylglycinamidine synthase